MIRTKYPLTKCCLAALTLACGFALRGQTTKAQAQEENAAAIPLKRVVMFSSGVAFFERGGQVTGDARLDLQFHSRDINDLLKSMVLQDLGGGRISTVSYGSKDPITRTLSTFSIDLTSNPTLADLLSQIRGERVEIEAPDKLAGTIVGVEHRTRRVGENDTVEVAFLNLLTEDGLRSVSLDNVGRIKLANAKLDAELRQALAILAMSHDTDKKTVSLNFLGAGERQVRVGYIQEAPIWKTSYRLVLSDDEAPLIQGWAIVENTTEEDWSDVNLTLVSGRPISFIMDLYQPLYVSRPVVMPELYASLRPRTYDQDLAEAEREFADAAGRPNASYESASLAKKDATREKALQEQNRALARSRNGDFAYADDKAQGGGGKAMRPGDSVRSVAQAGDVGEMFQYVIATPVSLERQRSAMLPIVNQSIEAEKVSIYNQAVHAKHPLNGARLKNTTDLHLMQGPITVFDGGAYAGDAQIQDLQPGTDRLISYAMDLDTEVAPTSDPVATHLLSAKFIKGVLHVSHKHTRKQSYVVKNSGSAAKKVLIEYPLDTNWKLLEPMEPAEKTRDLYRFLVNAEPGKPESIDIREERTIGQQIAVMNMDDNSIRYYINAKEVSQEVKDALSEVIKRKQALAQVVNQRNELDRQIQVIFQEQSRIRQNMTELPKDSELFRRYLTKFNEQEDSIEQLRAQVQQSIDDEAKQRKALDEFLIGLDLA